MKKDHTCPRCHHPVDPQVRYCGHCGADISLAAILVEPQSIILSPLPAGVRMSPELLVPRLGDFLIEKGLLEPKKLESALEFQRTRSAEGKPVLLGQALIELGFVDRSDLDETITQQILELHRKIQETNLHLEQRVQERTSELQHALVRLTELNQLKSNFISNVSHELRTPLTHIKGYLEILSDLSLGPLTPLQTDAIEVLKRAEDRLETLIEDLIQSSLAAKGEINIQLKPVALPESITTVIAQSRIKAQLKWIRLMDQIPEDIPVVLMDRQKISWVVGQLLDNAIKFTPREGEVLITAIHEQGIVTVTVKDNGIGIPSDRLSEIFEPFHQLDSSVSRRYSGTGLGLAMVRRILDAHGSEIRVESTVEQGSRFEFSLSIAQGYDG